MPIDSTKKEYKNPTFIGRGSFNRRTLLWWTRIAGYFVTDEQGFRLGADELRVPRSTLEKAIAGE